MTTSRCCRDRSVCCSCCSTVAVVAMLHFLFRAGVDDNEQRNKIAIIISGCVVRCGRFSARLSLLRTALKLTPLSIRMNSNALVMDLLCIVEHFHQRTRCRPAAVRVPASDDTARQSVVSRSHCVVSLDDDDASEGWLRLLTRPPQTQQLRQ